MILMVNVALFQNDNMRTVNLTIFSYCVGTVIVTCLPPIPTTGLTMGDLNDLIDRVWKQMQETIDNTTEEVENSL